MEHFFRRAAAEVALSAILSTVFSLFAVSLFAVFVRAFAPSDTTITVVNQIIKGAGIFLFSLIFIHAERAAFKGMAAGVLSLLFTTLLFGLIGGFRLGVLFLSEFPLAALMGCLGALCGVKLRKE